MKKFLLLMFSLVLFRTGLLFAQGGGIQSTNSPIKWIHKDPVTHPADTLLIKDSISDRFWGNWYISQGPYGLGLLDKDHKEILLPCFKTISYRPLDGEIDLPLRHTVYSFFLLQAKPGGPCDSIRVTTKDTKCPACNGRKYMLEEVAVWGTELRSTEYRKDITINSDRSNTIQISITEKKKPARDGYQWQERKCKACLGSGFAIQQKLLIKDTVHHSYRES